MPKTVADVMSHRVISCHPQTPIRRCARRMRENDVSALIVLDDDGHLAGILSQTDLVTLRAYRPEWEEMVAEHAMIRNVLTVTPDTPLEEACDLMARLRVHRLVVVEEDENGKHPIGVLSMTDVVREMAEGDENANA
ncbi:MAG: CBS domain-containing protein [Ardenticatenia bacterium]|nr:MAG: CBS domain-containing protein [Ardenticatenia bacterium]